MVYELGLVFALRFGDIFIFESSNLTHFNLEYTGYRGSLVMHTDSSIQRYMKDMNGWVAYLN